MKTWHIFPFKSLFFIIMLSFFFTSCGENGLNFLNGGSVIHVGKVTVSFTPTLIGGKDYKFLNTSVNLIGSESGIQYVWDFGDRSASVTKTDKLPFTYRFPEVSTKYTVSLTARSASGNILGVAQYLVTTGVDSSSGVTVSASFNAGLTSGKDVTFTNTTAFTGISESELQYIWNFGDGSVDKLKTDKIIPYRFPLFLTQYTVSLSVKNLTGQLLGFSSMDVITGVEPIPGVKVTAKFNAAPVTGSKNVNFINETTLVGIGDRDVKYVWNFGDGSAEETKTDKADFTHLFPDYSTKYPVTLKVIKNTTGGEILASVKSDVTTASDPAPAPSATASFIADISGKDVTFKNTSTLVSITEADVKYVWYLGDGVPVTKTDKADFAHTFPLFSTKYRVTLSVEKVSDGSVLGTKSIDVTTGIDPIVPSATAGFSVVATNGKNVTFRNTSTLTGITEGEVKYVWNFGDGTADVTKTGKADFTYTFPAFSRTYTVILQVKKMDGSVLGAPASFAITTGIDPIAPSAVADFTTVISGKNITFTNTSVLTAITEGNVKYVWDFGDGSADETKTNKLAFIHAFPSFSTKYTVTLRVLKSVDSSLLGTKSIEVTTGGDPTPPPSANANFSALNINGKTVTFNNTSSIMNITEANVKYEWNFGDSVIETKTDKVVTHTFPSFSTKYSVTLRVMNVLDGDRVLGTRSIDVTTGADPVVPPVTAVNADFTYSLPDFYSKNMTFTNTSSPESSGLQYIWEFGDTITETKTNRTPFTHTYSAIGTYNVKLTVKDSSGVIKGGPITKTISLGLFDTISTGPGHTLGLTPDGRIYSWGSNRDGGRLGLNDEVNRTSPTEVSTLNSKKIISIAAGSSHSLALTDDGRVYAWGDNSYGQLGMGSGISESFIPKEVTEFGGKKIESIIAGDNHNFAIADDYTVYTWGWNSASQMGLGRGERNKYFYTPSRHAELSAGLGLSREKIKLMAASNDFSFAVTETGSLYSWGINGFGNLGLAYASTNVENNFKDTPTLVSGINGVVSLATGTGHTIALTNTNKVYIWGGSGGSGQLGLGKRDPQSFPKELTFPSGETIVVVGVGNYFSFAVSNTGKVYSWGENLDGQLGLNNTTSQFTPTEIVFPFGGKSIKTISGGSAHTIAVNSDGIGYSWGFNFTGQLGLGHTSDQRVPQEMKK